MVSFKKKKKVGENRTLPMTNPATGVQIGLTVSLYNFTFYSPLLLPQRSVLFSRISHRHRCLLVLAEIWGRFGISVTQPPGREQATAAGRQGNECVLLLTVALNTRLHSQ